MKKMWNQIGRPKPPAVGEIKIFDNDDKAAKHSFSLKMFCSLQVVIIIKNFNFINSRRPWPPNLILHLFHPGLFSSWPLLFLHQGCFGWDFTSFLVVFPLNHHDLIVLIILLVYAGIFKSCRLDWPGLLNIAFVQVVGMHVYVCGVCVCVCMYVCVCPCPRLYIF